jgi:hypothetical protein
MISFNSVAKDATQRKIRITCPKCGRLGTKRSKEGVYVIISHGKHDECYIGRQEQGAAQLKANSETRTLNLLISLLDEQDEIGMKLDALTGNDYRVAQLRTKMTGSRNECRRLINELLKGRRAQ